MYYKMNQLDVNGIREKQAESFNINDDGAGSDNCSSRNRN